MSGWEWALMIVAVFWGLLILFLGVVMLNVFRLLESMKMMVDGVRGEAVPLLGEVRVTVRGLNRELDRVDTLLESAGNVSKSVERLAGTVESTVSSPLIKMAAWGAGIGRAVKRFRGA